MYDIKMNLIELQGLFPATEKNDSTDNHQQSLVSWQRVTIM